jgi:hypothetical protein
MANEGCRNRIMYAQSKNWQRYVYTVSEWFLRHRIQDATYS